MSDGGGRIFDLEGALTVDTSQIGSLAEQTRSQLAEIDGREVKAKVNVDDARAQSAIDSVTAQAKAMGHEIEKTHTIDVDTSKANAEFRSWRDSLKAEIFGPIDRQITETEARLADLKGESPSSGVGGVGTSMMRQVVVGAGGFMAATGGAVMTKNLAGDALGTAMLTRHMEASVNQVFGQAATQFQEQAEALADSTGFLISELEQAQITLNKTTASVGMSNQQLETMTKIATDLAVTSGLPQYAENLDATTAAIANGLKNGGAALMDFGVNLDDTYVKTLAANRAYAASWDSLTEAERAQARYNAILVQTPTLADDAAKANEEVGGSIRKFNQAMEEAKGAVGEVLLPIADTIGDFVANVPKPVLEAGVWAGIGVAMAATIGGAIIGLNALIVAIRSLATQSTAAAAQTAAGGGGRGMLGTLGGLGRGATAAGGASGVGGIASGLAGGAVLALPAVAIAGTAVGLQAYAASNAEKQLARDLEAGHKHDIYVAKATGRGDITDPEQVRYIATSWRYIDGQLASFNAYGQRLSSKIEEWQAAQRRGTDAAGSQAQTNVKVVIQDQTSGGVRAAQLDVGSYGASPY